MGQGDLCQLAYVSESRLTGGQSVITQSLQSILEQSRRNNERHGITGALLYSGGHFAQVLEGTEKAVIALFEHITTDSRHSRVFNLLYRNVKTRSFADWSMALTVVQPQEVVGLHEVHAHTDAMTIDHTGARLLDLMEQVMMRGDQARPVRLS